VRGLLSQSGGLILRSAPKERVSKDENHDGQRHKGVKVAADQRFFFGARPAFDLPFGCDRIDDAIAE